MLWLLVEDELSRYSPISRTKSYSVRFEVLVVVFKTSCIDRTGPVIKERKCRDTMSVIKVQIIIGIKEVALEQKACVVVQRSWEFYLTFA